MIQRRLTVSDGERETSSSSWTYTRKTGDSLLHGTFEDCIAVPCDPGLMRFMFDIDGVVQKILNVLNERFVLLITQQTRQFTTAENIFLCSI